MPNLSTACKITITRPLLNIMVPPMNHRIQSLRPRRVRQIMIMRHIELLP